ncbi:MULTISPECIES: cytochrome o ubiquinol oxidase subunit IV [Sphingomonas]|uniref:Cytochrome bo(3) ubiquinol oxidase subunit 4 n=1 Tax=Sphingomonas kyungheensis TaxID=1069987 RepID=A0ABU8H5M2_9SPHN|nr:cytochrome o ubiquinol oxidase subunit IV [Sphingomonas sp. RIT328]EZP51761.1 Cytochrome o ubiquinol oxidase operon protein cyoD [Sphingomonas sp. RIT328]
MSADTHHDHGHAPGAHGHDPHDNAHGHGHSSEGAHGSRKDYLIGFVLSVILTAIPFGLVMSGVIADPRITAGIIMVFALVQIVVHMIYFLHMNAKSEQGWTLMALIFTIIVLTICLAGSMWVMYHMNLNMMPNMGGDASAM